MNMRCLILPCETRVREFDAKLLLGVAAAARGIVSIVGSKKPIDLNLCDYPPGVYIGKSLTDRSYTSLAMAPVCGHRLAVWDEEGMVWASREVYWRTKVDGATLNLPELLIAWGEDNAAAWREHPDYKGVPVSVAGNPRTDLLQPALRDYFAEEVTNIRREQGSFVLINTNFSRVNHMQPRQNRHLKWLREQRPNDPRGGFARHKFDLFNAFCHMLPALARALPDTRFVIRPHPSEAQSVWEELARDLPNVTVNRQGNVTAWLIAADAVIHNGCTTAVEAFVLGCPALAYMPVRSPDYDHPLPNGVSLQCDDLNTLIDQVRECRQDRAAMFARQSGDQSHRNLMARSIAGYDQVTMACERIFQALQPLLENPDPPPGARPHLAAILLTLRRTYKRIKQHIPGTPNYRPYLAHMFPDTSRNETQRRVDKFARCLGLADAPVVEVLHDNVFRLQPVKK